MMEEDENYGDEDDFNNQYNNEQEIEENSNN